MVATLHSPKIGEKSDSQTWTKEKHKRRPPSLRGTSMNLHTTPNVRAHSHEIMDDRTCFPTHTVSPETKESILHEKDHAHFPPVRKESEQNDSLCEEEQNVEEKPKQTTVIQKWGNPFSVQDGGRSYPDPNRCMRQRKEPVRERRTEPPIHGLWILLTQLGVMKMNDRRWGEWIEQSANASWRECKCERSGFLPAHSCPH